MANLFSVGKTQVAQEVFALCGQDGIQGQEVLPVQRKGLAFKCRELRLEIICRENLPMLTQSEGAVNLVESKKAGTSSE